MPGTALTKNPYRPGVGLQPAYLAGREKQQRRFVSALASAPEIPANIRLTGLRGVGKSVLLERFSQLARDTGWATVLLELQPSHNSERGLQDVLAGHLENLRDRLSTARRLRKKIGTATTAARGVVKAEFEGVTWSVDGAVSSAAQNLGDVLVDAVHAAARADRDGLVLLLDEAQLLTDDKGASGQHPLSMVLSAVSTLQKRQLNIALVLCGLPTLTVNLLAARTYSERMFRGEQVDSLEAADAREAFLKPLEDTGRSAENDLVERVMDDVDGYPYFIQLWGAELWDSATYAESDALTIEVLDLAHDDIYRRLDLDFYEPRIDSLTPAEQDLLLDSSRCDYPPLVVADLTGQSVKSPGNVNVLLGRLVTSNVLYRVRKGQYRYTAPGFHEFLRRRAELL